MKPKKMFKVRYDGTMTTIVECPPDDPNAQAFGTAKAELLKWACAKRDDWVRLVNDTRLLRMTQCQDPKPEAPQ